MIAAPSPTIDLREAVARAPMTLSLGGLAEEHRLLALEHWRVHMAAELASARVFAALVPQLMAASVDATRIFEVSDMVRQELDHGVLSARVFAALGGDPRSALPPLPPVPTHEGCAPLEALARNVMSISCCGETLAVAVLGSERERAVEEPLRRTLTTILADEVGHARFGWRLLGEVVPALDAEARRRLSAYLVAIFARDLGEVAKGRHRAPAPAEALALGAPDGPLAFELYVETMREATIPGLERLGVHARWAFAHAWRRVLGDEELPPGSAARA